MTPHKPKTPPLGGYATKRLAGTASPRTTTGGAGTYDGAELRPYTGRPGSMDAYKLPSLGANSALDNSKRR